MLLIADLAILTLSTPAGLQNQLNHLKNEADRLYLSGKLDQTNMVFRIGGQIGVKCIKYWIRLPLLRLCRQTYEMLRTEYNQDRKNRVSKNTTNIKQERLSQGVGYKVPNFRQNYVMLQTELNSCYKRNWHSDIKSNEKYK